MLILVKFFFKEDQITCPLCVGLNGNTLHCKDAMAQRTAEFNAAFLCGPLRLCALR